MHDWHAAFEQSIKPEKHALGCYTKARRPHLVPEHLGWMVPHVAQAVELSATCCRSQTPHHQYSVLYSAVAAVRTAWWRRRSTAHRRHRRHGRAAAPLPCNRAGAAAAASRQRLCLPPRGGDVGCTAAALCNWAGAAGAARRRRRRRAIARGLHSSWRHAKTCAARHFWRKRRRVMVVLSAP